MRVAPAAVAFLACAVAAAASAGPVAHPIPKPGAIVFASTRIVNHSFPDVFLADARGRRLNLTQTANVSEEAYDLSPDGSEVVLWRGGVGNGLGDLFLLSLARRRLTRLTDTPTEREHEAAFSPTGDAIAFVRGLRPISVDLWVLEQDGRERRLTSDGKDKGSIVWSPDGRRIAYVQGSEILVIDRAGGSPRRFASFTSSPAAHLLLWRPDGILIPFERANAGFGLRRITEAGELSTVPNVCGQLFPIWSIDHLHVACTSRVRPRTVAVRTVAGRVVRRVALYPLGQTTRAGVAGLGAKGAPLIYTATVQDRDADLWLLDGTLRKLTTGAGEDHDPSWEPNRRRVVFVRSEREQRSGRRGRLMLADVRTGRARPLRPGLVGRDPDWSPDGRSIVFSRDRDVFVLHVATGRPVRLTGGSAEDVDPAWSPDGRTIAFVHQERRAELSTIPARGGRRSVLVSRTDVRDPAWSPDGRAVAFSTVRSIEIVQASARRVERVVDDVDNNLRSPTWTPDGRALVYAAGWEADIPWPWEAPNARPVELWRVGLTDGSVAPLVRSAGYNFDPEMAR